MKPNFWIVASTVKERTITSMAESPDGTIQDEREESMVPPNGGNPILRIGHFPNPSVTSIGVPVFNQPSDSLYSLLSHSKLNKIICLLQVTLNGWRNPPKHWGRWVDCMQSQYKSVWKQARILEPILNSTYKIHKHAKLVCEIAEKWCPEINTFVFPFGESTITVEDMMVLGGLLCSGSLCFNPFRNRRI